jgi:hypothetical protein
MMSPQLRYNHIILPLETGEVVLMDESGRCLSKHDSTASAIREAKRISGDTEDYVGCPAVPDGEDL